MPSLTEFCKISAKLTFAPIGKLAGGMRVDLPFTGTATSSHWEGERPVTGIDYVTVRKDGSQELNIRGQIGSGKDVVAYTAAGRGDADGARELFLFETANDELAWLNNAVGVALGAAEGDALELTVYIATS